jgi:hypothetical protein
MLQEHRRTAGIRVLTDTKERRLLCGWKKQSGGGRSRHDFGALSAFSLQPRHVFRGAGAALAGAHSTRQHLSHAVSDDEVFWFGSMFRAMGQFVTPVCRLARYQSGCTERAFPVPQDLSWKAAPRKPAEPHDETC